MNVAGGSAQSFGEMPPAVATPPAGRGRVALLLSASVAIGALVGVALLAWWLPDDGLLTRLDARALPPSLTHWFGTDALGRDMFTRTVEGLAVSLRVGLLAAAGASAIALLMGLLCALGPRIDALVSLIIDATLSVPHLVLLILVSFALGGGVRGVIVAIAVTHWPSLARLVRAQLLQVLACDYVRIARGLGRSPRAVAIGHVLPHVMPQLLVGAVLVFPHAILHEAAMSFLGFGLEPHLPATGLLLAESMRYLGAGWWWLALLPGASLLMLVLAFERVGAGLRRVLEPRESQH